MSILPIAVILAVALAIVTVLYVRSTQVESAAEQAAIAAATEKAEALAKLEAQMLSTQQELQREKEMHALAAQRALKAHDDVEARIAAATDAAMTEWTASQAKAIRADAKKRATSADMGSLGENFTPLITQLDPKDFRHLGDPIDFLYVQDYDAVRRREKDVIGKVVLLDTKVGKGQLTTGQRRIRDAVVEGRVYFAVFTPGKGIRYWPPLPEETDEPSEPPDVFGSNCSRTTTAG